MKTLITSLVLATIASASSALDLNDLPSGTWYECQNTYTQEVSYTKIDSFQLHPESDKAIFKFVNRAGYDEVLKLMTAGKSFRTGAPSIVEYDIYYRNNGQQVATESSLCALIGTNY